MNGAGSHIPLLASVVAIARPGAVLELGVGENSTPLLREMCHAMGRELVSVDTTDEWASKYGAHTLLSAPVDLFSRTWAVVFIDTSPPPNRLELLQLVRHHAEFIVIHDTDNQGGDLTEMIDYMHEFKHAHTVCESTPWTSVVSDTRGYQ